jgi:hypothetical protein
VTAEGLHRPGLVAILFERGIVRRSLVLAAVVGTILNLINQGDALLGGTHLVAWKIVLTYCVPYCVASYGAVTARLEMMKRSARVA